jgi:hypothetical protein
MGVWVFSLGYYLMSTACGFSSTEGHRVGYRTDCLQQQQARTLIFTGLFDAVQDIFEGISQIKAHHA